MPELLPGMLYTGELFARALVRRMGSRFSEGVRSGGRSGVVGSEEERVASMAALAMVQRPQPGSGGNAVSRAALGSVWTSEAPNRGTSNWGQSGSTPRR
jgi:hypothetical protein